mmetsp:Transcript_88346/g.152751  ORF Transcript_88346/g.152751 Transcript_88346/m.152751 type:complete len:346 (-) Transcript_88346:94-1131(-)
MASRAPLHLPRSHEEPLVDDQLLKRANRLAAAARNLDGIDLKAIAASYQDEAGASAIEAAGVAAATLNAALKASLGGSSQAAEVAEKEARSLGKRQARDARSVALLNARVQENSKLAQAVREEIHRSLDARSEQAVMGKERRLAEEAAASRAMREERMIAASTQRNLSEARAWIGRGSRSNNRLAMSANVPSFQAVPSSAVTDDPVLRRAKTLVASASNVIAQLEEQNQMLLRNSAAQANLTRPQLPRHVQSSRSLPSSPARSRAPGPGSRVGTARQAAIHAAHASVASREEDALLARANALLADYKPTEQKRKALRVDSGIDSDGAAKLARARQLVAAVDINSK